MRNAPPVGRALAADQGHASSAITRCETQPSVDVDNGLVRELKAAAYRVTRIHYDRLRCLGVSIPWLAEWMAYGAGWPIGVDRCEPYRCGLYQPNSDNGVPCLILPVVEDGGLVDLVAFRTSDPGTWWLRTGNALALGLEKGLEPHLWFQRADPSAKPPKHQVGQPAHLCSHPLDWLRRAGDGLCVVDWSAPDIRRLDVLPEVICSDPQTASLLKRALSRPQRLPAISVMETALVA